MKLEDYGGRRWLTTVGIILIATGLRIAELIGDALWVDVVKWVFGIFATGNVGQRVVEAAKEVKAGRQAEQ